MDFESLSPNPSSRIFVQRFVYCLVHISLFQSPFFGAESAYSSSFVPYRTTYQSGPLGTPVNGLSFSEDDIRECVVHDCVFDTFGNFVKIKVFVANPEIARYRVYVVARTHLHADTVHRDDLAFLDKFFRRGFRWVWLLKGC